MLSHLPQTYDYFATMLGNKVLFFLVVENQSNPDKVRLNNLCRMDLSIIKHFGVCQMMIVYSLCPIKPDRPSEPINSKTEKGKTAAYSVIFLLDQKVAGGGLWSLARVGPPPAHILLTQLFKLPVAILPCSLFLAC